jgi:hypothetical protein
VRHYEYNVNQLNIAEKSPSIEIALMQLLPNGKETSK